jgi:transposase-like protein
MSIVCENRDGVKCGDEVISDDGAKCAEFGEIIKVDEALIRQHVEEVVRQSVEETLNGLLDAEADALCGARRYERSPDRLDTRAGHYQRKLQTKAGEVTLNVPRLRTTIFETQIIERYRRRESSTEEALVEMYLAGVSLRRVEDITEALWGTRVSASAVSELNQKIYARIEAWRNRPIEGEHPYVFLDGIWLERTWGGEVEKVAVLVAIGVGADGHREILGVCEGAKEDKESWRNFLRHLTERGLRGVRLVVSDKCLGLLEALGEFFPAAKWQRCVVHWYRNVFTAVPRGKAKAVAAMLKAIHAQEDRAAARCRCGGEVGGDEVAEGGRDRARGRGGNAGLHVVPDGALAADTHEQSAGADHARDSAADARGGSVSRRPLGVDAGGGAAASHRRHALGREALYGHGSAAGTGARGARRTACGERVNCENYAACPLGGRKDS